MTYTSESVIFAPMINFLHRFFVSPKYFSVLPVFFAVYLITFFLGHTWNNPLIAILQLVGGIFFLVFGTGASLVLILQRFLKRKFDFWEFTSLSLLGSLLIPPLLLILEFSLLKTISFWFPLANSFMLWCVAWILLFFHKTSLPSLTFIKPSLRHPLGITLLFGIFLTLIQVLSFQTLPDLDPYKWLFKYTYQFANHLLDYSERPLFGSFVYIATTLTGLSIFDFFKYALPFLFLLILFPAWMVARVFPDTKKQWLFLLFAFTSPNIILYSGTAMPQVPLIIITYFFVFFLLYSSIEKDDIFLYASGLSLFLTFFYHQAAFIIFMAWLIPVVIAKRKILLSDRKTVFFTIIILLSNFYHLRPIYEFSSMWVRLIIQNFFRANNLNLLYPVLYTNTDNNVMGWGSLSGVIRFYSYYIGPMLGLILFSFLFLLFQKKIRTSILEQSSNISSLILIISFGSFFAIAEILPRFPGIALLPERAWIFCGIFAYIFLYLLLRCLQKISSAMFILFLLFFTIGISGTLYINSLKRYLISPMQLESAEWIRSNLPDNRIFLSYGYRALLPVYADTPLVKIPAHLYCENDLSEFRKLYDDFNAPENALIKQNFLEQDYKPFIKRNYATLSDATSYLDSNNIGVNEKYSSALKTRTFLTNQLDDLREPPLKDKITIINPLSSPPQIVAPILNEDIFRFNSISSLDGRPLYIYYSQMHLKNPYRGRSYSMTSWGIEPCADGEFLFDRYPDTFQRIYARKDPFDEVIIWKIL